MRFIPGDLVTAPIIDVWLKTDPSDLTHRRTSLFPRGTIALVIAIDESKSIDRQLMALVLGANYYGWAPVAFMKKL